MREDLKAVLMASIKKKVVELSDGKKVTIRPMLMKEMKIIMNATENKKEPEEFMTEIIKNCVQEKINIDTLTIFDCERLSFEIWKLARTSPIMSSPFVCKNEVDGKECGTDIMVDINLNTVALSREPETLIKLNKNISVKMRYPNMTEQAFFDLTNEADFFDLCWRLVEEVHFNNQVMKVGIDIQLEELLELNEYVSSEEITPMFEFVNNVPHLVLDVPVKCPCCGHHEAVRLNSIDEICFQ
ncbi:gp26 family baseplate hub assembly chaperone [Aeromonas piscicola]|uniref:gp26 family baseplate hub assembly chaperone n=1 Tax=Aeromonas piscicola TaxID=600645 RepID=UPI0021F8CCEB|nr:gp26 family baseplate hub assembly chaperone [Aeromonas piscicola]MCW0507027.1 gp26 family baseplate hub assembly chaperone [Aeromonas piscicola]